MKKNFIFLLLLSPVLSAQNVSKNAFPIPQSVGSTELISKYLSNKDSAQILIPELIKSAHVDEGNGNLIDAFKKFQIALILEKNLPPESPLNFELNFYAADFIYKLDKSYALYFFRKADEAIKKCKIIPAEAQFNFYTNCGGLYTTIGARDSALYFYRLASEKANTAPFRNVASASAQNNIGVFYAKLLNADSAMFYFYNALEVLQTGDNDIMLYCSITDNIAQQKELKHDYAAALTTYRFNDSTFFSMGRHNRYLVNKIRYLKALEFVHSNEVDAQIKLTNSYIDNNANTEKFRILKEDVIGFYRFAANFYFRSGNKPDAETFNQKYLSLNDNIQNQNKEKFKLLTATLLNVQKMSFENELKVQQLEAEKKSIQLKSIQIILIVSVLTGAAIIFLLILFIRKRKQEHETSGKLAEAKITTKELEAKAAMHELELKKKDITNLVLHNTQVYESNKKLIDRLNEISKTENSDFRQSVSSMMAEIKNHNSIGENAISIQNNIDTVNAEFYEKLNKSFAGLTKAEEELCGYIRINLSTKDISILKNIEADSVKVSKKRLRKKLGITPDDDLYGLIQNLG